MNAKVTCDKISGEVNTIPSKSFAHRLLIGAALSTNPTVIDCRSVNDDIIATANCLKSIGAEINYTDGTFYVTPSKNVKSNILDCNESGTTLRLLLPIVCAIGGEWKFIMRGRLSKRPLDPLKDELAAHGISFNYEAADRLCVSGKLTSGDYSISGEISSQFISGLLFALSILKGKSTLTVTGKLESAPYVGMTLDVLKSIGADIKKSGQIFYTNGTDLTTPEKLSVEGDWSNAAFLLSAAALKGSITLNNINTASKQGDMQIFELLKRFGASVTDNQSSVTVKSNKLCGLQINAQDIPDLVPILSVVAATATGDTHIYGASRLRIKESDRLQTTYELLDNLGADVELKDDGFIIHGKEKLRGGVVNSYNDHRIAMSAAIASILCENEVEILDAMAVSKSYPDFWQDIKKLGFNVKLI